MLGKRPSAFDGRVFGVAVHVLVLSGAVLMVASAAVHLHLWAGTYRHIPTVGPLFLFQGIFAVLLAVALALLRCVGLMVLGALLMVSTAAGLLLSTWISLFGYKENLAVPYAGMSLVIEFVGAALLVAAAGVLVARSGPGDVSPGAR